MVSLEFVQGTTLSNNGIHEVGEAEGPASGDSDIAQLQEDLTTERERRLRLLAEFDNYRRRTKNEAALAEATGKREVLLTLLDVKDDVDRALLHIRETSDAVADGLRLIHQYRRGYLMNGKLLRPARVAVLK